MKTAEAARNAFAAPLSGFPIRRASAVPSTAGT